MKKKKRELEDKKKLVKRLRVIEGQIRGIEKMVEEDRYCADILIQLSAVSQALKGLGNEILRNHLSTCVVEDIQNNRLEVVEEVFELFTKFNR